MWPTSITRSVLSPIYRYRSSDSVVSLSQRGRGRAAQWKTNIYFYVPYVCVCVSCGVYNITCLSHTVSVAVDHSTPQLNEIFVWQIIWTKTLELVRAILEFLQAPWEKKILYAQHTHTWCNIWHEIESSISLAVLSNTYKQNRLLLFRLHRGWFWKNERKRK